jgi:hypothetical protein
MDPKDRTLESMNMFGKRDPTQLLNPSAKRAKIDTTLDSDDIDLENPDETPDIEIIEQEETEEPGRNGPSAEAPLVIEESEVNLKSVKKLRLLAERGGHLGTQRKGFLTRADRYLLYSGLNDIFQKHKFVGLIPDMTSALIQHETKLYCLDYHDFA